MPWRIKNLESALKELHCFSIKSESRLRQQLDSHYLKQIDNGD